MKKIALVFVAFVLSACNGSAARGATDADMRKAVESGFTNLGKVVEITKLNGQQAEFAGIKLHAFYFRTVIALRPGFRWIYDKAIAGNAPFEFDIPNPKPEQIEKWNAEQSRPLPAGTIYVMTGEVHLRLGDNGWTRDRDAHVLRFGICPKEGPSECIKSLKLEDASWRPDFN